MEMCIYYKVQNFFYVVLVLRDAVSSVGSIPEAGGDGLGGCWPEVREEVGECR